MDKVIFRKFEDGQVIAIFPEVPATMHVDECLSYMHIGQHGACSESLIDELERAKSSEYGDLFDELESIGYKLHIVEDISPEMIKIRVRELL